MSDKKIIVAYDGSADSKKALNMAIELARPLFAKILLVSVYDVSLLNLPDAADIIDFNKLEKSLREIFMERAEDGKKYCEEKRSRCTWRIWKEMQLQKLSTMQSGKTHL